MNFSNYNTLEQQFNNTCSDISSRKNPYQNQLASQKNKKKYPSSCQNHQLEIVEDNQDYISEINEAMTLKKGRKSMSNSHQIEMGDHTLTIKHQQQEQLNENNQQQQDVKHSYKPIVGTLLFQQNNQEQQNERYYFKHQIGTLFKNCYTDVKFSYSDQVGTFIVTKKILNQDSKIKEECKILEYLKGKNITLDMISINESDNSLEQIAGKTDFHTLKKKQAQNVHFFELYFLILLDKLRKMHELNLAHSDIKPQNIVISYDNEPFFIDFDASVKLQDYKEYLKCFTPTYNLDKYCKMVNNNNMRQFIIKEFENEEEVKLCDQTQLALTFLFLFCNDESQERFFFGKKFNQLIESLYQIKDENGKAVLSIISRILNQADSEIKIKEYQEGKLTLAFEDNLITEELKKSDDVIYQGNDKNPTYVVHRIDQFSIKLIYLLDSLHDCKLRIEPDKIKIIPQPQMKEYQHICYQYVQIQQHLNRLVQGEELDEIKLHNLCEYIKILQNQKCLIQIKDNKQFQELIKAFKNSKNLDTLQITLQFNEEFLKDFVGLLQNAGYFIESLKLNGQKIDCKIIKNTIQMDISLIIYLQNVFQFDKTENFDFLKNKFRIKQIQVHFYNQSVLDDINCQTQVQEILQNLMKIQESLINENHQCLLSIQLQSDISYKESNFLFQQKIFQDLFKNREDKTNLKYNIKKCEEISLQLNKQLDQTRQIHLIKKENNQFTPTLKKVICQNGENFHNQSLNQITKFESIFQTITFKFFNFLFLEENLWLDFVQRVEQNNNLNIEIIVVYCQFTENVVEILQDLQKRFSFVKYEVVEEFENYLEEIESYKISYQMNAKQSLEQIGEHRLKIKFFKFVSRKEYEENKQSNNPFLKSGMDIDRCIQMINENSSTQHYRPQGFFPKSSVGCIFKGIRMKEKFNEYNSYYDQINNKSMRNQLGYQQSYKIPLQQKVNILIGKQIQEITINKKNKIVDRIKDINDLKFIVKDINNKQHYKTIQFVQNPNYFSYYEDDQYSQNKNQVSHFLKMHIYSEGQSGDYSHRQQLYQIYQAIFDNYSNIYQNFGQELEQRKQYKQLTIQQFCLTDSIKQKYEELFQINGNITTTLQYSFAFNQQVYYNNDKVDPETIRTFIHKQEFIKNLNKFQAKFCFSNSPVSPYFLKDKDYIKEFNFNKLNLGDQTFRILFEEMETLFSQNQKWKWYLFKQCNLTAQSLYISYDILKRCKANTIIKIDFTENNISYLEFKQLINLILSENSVHEFIFEIYLFDEKISQFIKNEFIEQCKINERDLKKENKFLFKKYSEDINSYLKYSCSKYKELPDGKSEIFNRLLILSCKPQPSSSQQLSNCKFKIQIDFSQINFPEELQIQIKQQLTQEDNDEKKQKFQDTVSHNTNDDEEEEEEEQEEFGFNIHNLINSFKFTYNQKFRTQNDVDSDKEIDQKKKFEDKLNQLFRIVENQIYKPIKKDPKILDFTNLKIL